MNVKHVRALVLSTLLLISHTIFANQLIIEPDMGRAPLLNSIEKAKHSIDLVMYGFTDETLLEALLAKKNHGTDLKVILEPSPYRAADENSDTIAIFKKNNVQWIPGVDNMRLTHQKTLILDDKKAIVMTFNFSHSSFDVKASHPQRNFGLIIDDPKMAQDIAEVFNADFQHQRPSMKNDDLIYSPYNSREKWLQYINQAKHSIKMYAQSISDKEIVNALSDAGNRGVKIEILTTDKSKQAVYQELTQSGVDLEISKHYYIHAKVIIIDNQIAILGSINLTRASLDDNRELAVVIRDASIIQKLNDTFQHDWQSSEHKITRRSHQKTFTRQLKQFMKSMQF